MGILCDITGPESKFKKDILYTYEARVIISDDEFTSFFADTICALVEYLVERKVEPGDVELYEIYKHEERKLNKEHCVADSGTWLSRKELYVAFTERYPGHIHEIGGTFGDRERGVTGP